MKRMLQTLGRTAMDASFADSMTTQTSRSGRRLANLMIEHNVGVATARSVHIKRIDQDYFDAEGV